MIVAALHATTLAEDCLQRNAWICPEYVRTRWPDISAALSEHVLITVVSVALGTLLAFPMALLARRLPRFRGPVVGVSTALYTIPSLAMFSLLLPFTGLAPATVVTGLTLYSLTILVRNFLAGFDGVPEDVREAARGMGYGPGRLLFGVELPLALPSVFAGLRVATVSTVALTTIGVIVGFGGLGNLISRGLSSFFRAEVLTAAVLCVALAVAADLLLLGAQRLATPWRRGVNA
ncbi:MAG TPA: ABC transporter permease [Jiangellales bacterium]|nr:ABC transporter permease [Jiangellales bacterium]